MPSPSPLRRLLFEADVSQQQIADAIGMDKAHFSRIVNGLHPGERTRADIADELSRQLGRRVTVEELWPADPSAVAS